MVPCGCVLCDRCGEGDVTQCPFCKEEVTASSKVGVVKLSSKVGV